MKHIKECGGNGSAAGLCAGRHQKPKNYLHATFYFYLFLNFSFLNLLSGESVNFRLIWLLFLLDDKSEKMKLNLNISF